MRADYAGANRVRKGVDGWEWMGVEEGDQGRAGGSRLTASTPPARPRPRVEGCVGGGSSACAEGSSSARVRG